MTRFVQAVPEPADPYAGDPMLRAWLRRYLPDEGDADSGSATARLRALAADVVGPLRRRRTSTPRRTRRRWCATTRGARG